MTPTSRVTLIELMAAGLIAGLPDPTGGADAPIELRSAGVGACDSRDRAWRAPLPRSSPHRGGSGVQLKVMSERLGHASTQITADLYQHVMPGMGADAATKIAGLLRRVQ